MHCSCPHILQSKSGTQPNPEITVNCLEPCALVCALKKESVTIAKGLCCHGNVLGCVGGSHY